MTTVTDDFAGTGALGASWSLGVGGAAAGTFSRNGGFLTPDATGSNANYFRNDFSSASHQRAKLTISTIPVFGSGYLSIGPVIHYEDSGGTCYYAGYIDNVIFVNKVGGAQQISAAVSMSSGDTLELRSTVTGGSVFLEVLKNGIPVGSATDGSRLTGTRIGFNSYSADSATRADDFEGGDYVPSGGASTLMSKLTQLSN